MNIQIAEKQSERGLLRVVIYKAREKDARYPFTVQAFASHRDNVTTFDNLFDAMDYANAHLNGAHTVNGEWA
jgi:hypothetical protein